MNDNRVVCQHPHRVRRGRYSVVRSHAHFGAWYSRFPGTGPAPADTARGQLMGSCFFVPGWRGGRTHRLLFCPLVLRSNEIWCAVRTVARRQHAATASAPTASVSYSECCSLHAFAAMGHERLQGLEAIVKTAKNVQQTLPQRSAAAAKLELASVLQALAVLGVRTTWGWVQ